VRYDFKERLIVPTHYKIRTNNSIGYYLKSWLVETSTGGKNWEEVDHKEDNEQLNGSRFTGTFGFAGGGACRFIRMVNIGNNHYGSGPLCISAWEIFGSLIEKPADSCDVAFRQAARAVRGSHRRA
jgi:hypothetical protein